MNPDKEQFEPVTDDTPDNWYTIAIGDECTINTINCKVRKITKKDIICRPVDFKQIIKVIDL